jgi:uncharacterized protein (DUF433 family)
MDWRRHISVDPNVCHGKPCVAGTRVMVSVVLANLAEGMTASQIVEHYPSITVDDVQAVLGYAATMADERFIALEESAS